jgi:hypothetical protein
LAGWFPDEPSLVEPTKALLCLTGYGEPWVEAAINLLGRDEEAKERVWEEVPGDDPGDLADYLERFCLARVDPAALEALYHIIFEGDYREEDRTMDHILRWGSLELLTDSASLRYREAAASRIPLRGEPEVLDLCWSILEEQEPYTTEKLLSGLARRADPASLEPLLRRWPLVLSESCYASDYYCNVEWEGVTYLVDGLVATPDGRAELERLSTDDDQDLALLARCFLLRREPSAAALQDLLVRRERHGDPNDVVFAPLQQLLETGGLEAWEPPAPVDPEPRVPPMRDRISSI